MSNNQQQALLMLDIKQENPDEAAAASAILSQGETEQQQQQFDPLFDDDDQQQQRMQVDQQTHQSFVSHGDFSGQSKSMSQDRNFNNQSANCNEMGYSDDERHFDDDQSIQINTYLNGHQGQLPYQNKQMHELQTHLSYQVEEQQENFFFEDSDINNAGIPNVTLIEQLNSDLLVSLQQLIIVNHTEDGIKRLLKVFEPDKKVLELMNKYAKEQELANKKPNIAKKTAAGSMRMDYMASEAQTAILVNHVGTDGREVLYRNGMVVNSGTGGGVKEDPRIALAAKTNERLLKFGIVNLRTCDVYMLKKVLIDPVDIQASPLFTRSRQPQLSDEMLKIEEQMFAEMRDRVNGPNPTQSGETIFD
eukprot:403334991